jgi:hypothetical protein
VDISKTKKIHRISHLLVCSPVDIFAQALKNKNPVNTEFTGLCIVLHDKKVEIRGIEPLTL